MRRYFSFALFSLPAALLLAAQPLWAAQEEGAKGGYFTAFQFINFALVAGAIIWVLVKKAPAFFAARAAEIGSAIDEGSKVKAQAEARRDEAKKRLANLASEVEELRAAALRDAAAEAERIQAATREEAAKIERAAQAEVDAALRSARHELRAVAARLSVERAEALLRAEMTPGAEEGIFNTFLGELAPPGSPAGRPN